MVADVGAYLLGYVDENHVGDLQRQKEAVDYSKPRLRCRFRVLDPRCGLLQTAEARHGHRAR